MKTINLPIYGITVTLEEQGCGTITSKGLHTKHSNVEDEEEDEAFNSAIDGVESMILACACAGIDIQDKRFLEAITTAVESCSDNT